jgi:hypothetical protein
MTEEDWLDVRKPVETLILSAMGRKEATDIPRKNQGKPESGKALTRNGEKEGQKWRRVAV